MARLQYKSRNCNRRFRKAARIIAGKIAGIDGVVGIAAAGGIARGHSDKFSDLDLIVYAEADRQRKIGKYIAVGQMHYRDTDYDVQVESFQRAMRHPVPSAYWSQERRWTLEPAVILHDSGGRIADMIARKVIYPESERKRQLIDNRHWADEILNYMYPAWQARGRAHNLAHLLRTATEHIMLWIYAHNSRFHPYMRKWPFYYLENGLVPESLHFAAIKRAFMAAIETAKQADAMRQDLFDLCARIGIGIEPITPKEVIRINSGNWRKASDRTRAYLSW